MSDVKLYLVEVLPITKTAGPRPLSYFSSAKLSANTLVRVPVRKNVVAAVVISSRSVKNEKSSIRNADFPLRKIGKKDVLKAAVSPALIAAAKSSAKYHAVSVGAFLFAILPKDALEEPETFLPPTPKSKRKVLSPKEPLLLQMETEERFGQYRAKVRQSFAQECSVIFVVPTYFDMKKAERELARGIGEFVYLWDSRKKTSAMKAWRKALEETHPVLFITTPSGLTLPRKDLGTIIVERENSRAYRGLARPYLNFKSFIESYSRHAGYDLVLGDSVLSIETLWREKQGEFNENSLLRSRLPGAATRLADAKSPQDKKGRFEIFSDELKDLIERALFEDKKIFLFGVRKGLYPTTVCGHCGSVLECLNCRTPVVLHRRSSFKNNHRGSTLYVCHACGTLRESKTVCGYCKSWKLVPLGIGTEEIARAARELYPEVTVTILDKEHVPGDSQARKIAENFSAHGGILVGTELAFFHLEETPYSGLVSADALFSVPDFGINERIFYLVSRLREMTEKELLIQTRNIGQQTLSFSAQGLISDFYSNEIGERKSLSYPPFSIFIKIEGAETARGAVLELKERFAEWQPDVFKNSLVIRIPREQWPNEKLASKLTLLPPQFSVKVDPESIL